MKKLMSICLLLVCAYAQAAPKFTLGEDYQVVVKTPQAPAMPKDKVVVTEFFSYGCPWCYRLEPKLEDWLKIKSKNVEFRRVPVVFEPGWNYYAKAYYTATALGINDKMTPLLFDAIQKQRKRLKSNNALATFFTEQGVKPEVARRAFEASPSLDAKINQGVALMQAYQVYLVPTVVVNGQFKTDLKLAKGDGERMMQIVQYLVDKSKIH